MPEPKEDDQQSKGRFVDSSAEHWRFVPDPEAGKDRPPEADEEE